MERDRIKVGVIGAGYWGPNLIRNFSQNPACVVTRVADIDAERRAYVQRLYPGVSVSEDFRAVTDAGDVDAVCVCTPVRWHYRMARHALLEGKHVLVEKPLTSTVADAEELCALARDGDRVLLVDHTFEYTAAVNHIKRLVAQGDLGELYYVSMRRLNLGLFQTDINVVWDLAPHDISILNYVLGKRPQAVAAHGRANILAGIEDVAMLTINYPDGPLAYVHVSWLDPSKVRRATFVGSRRMLEYDDVEPLEKVRIFDKGVDGPKHYDTFGDFQLSYRYGDIHTPFLESHEPLQEECRHFVACICGEAEPRSGGEDGLSVVRVLAAAQRSIENGGALEEVL